MKQKYLLVLSGVIVVAAVVVLTLLQVRSVRSGPQASTPTPPLDGPNLNGPSVLPVRPTAIQLKIVDLAPNIPYEDKPSVVVQHADGSRDRYLLAPEAVDAFVKNLPNGDKLMVRIPAPSMLGNPQPPLGTKPP